MPRRCLLCNIMNCYFDLIYHCEIQIMRWTVIFGRPMLWASVIDMFYERGKETVKCFISSEFWKHRKWSVLFLHLLYWKHWICCFPLASCKPHYRIAYHISSQLAFSYNFLTSIYFIYIFYFIYFTSSLLLRVSSIEMIRNTSQHCYSCGYVGTPATSEVFSCSYFRCSVFSKLHGAQGNKRVSSHNATRIFKVTSVGQSALKTTKRGR